MAGAPGADRRHPGPDRQDSRAAAQAGSAGRAAPIRWTALTDPALRELCAVRCSETRRICRRRSTRWSPRLRSNAGGQRQRRTRQASSRSEYRGGGRGAMPRAGRGPLSVRRAAADMPLADFGDVFGYGGAVRQVLHREPREAGRTVAASVDLASRLGAAVAAACSRSSNGRSVFARCSSVRARRCRSSTSP